MTREELLEKAQKPAEEALQLHAYYKGKIQTAPKCPLRGIEDFSIWYTPGVAAPCRAIQRQPELVYEHTNKANSIAVVSDGTRSLAWVTSALKQDCRSWKARRCSSSIWAAWMRWRSDSEPKIRRRSFGQSNSWSPPSAGSVSKISPCPSVSMSSRNVEDPVLSLCGTTISKERGPCFWRRCSTP